MTFIIQDLNQSQRIVALTEGDHMLEFRDVCALQDITDDVNLVLANQSNIQGKEKQSNVQRQEKKILESKIWTRIFNTG